MAALSSASSNGPMPDAPNRAERIASNPADVSNDTPARTAPAGTGEMRGTVAPPRASRIHPAAESTAPGPSAVKEI